jgi:tRNA nucleotidyltransferase (CCA-adding enzyme)
MHIITTHTNADFDAVASLLGAWHLYPDATPVLPPTLNRNVRDFITLYESELPFLHQNELDRKSIDQVTLVDTQYLYKIKNLKANVKLHIIDHHELHQPLPPEATLTLTDTGATVTLLVEQICDLAKRLSPIEATLMLLGIYEDTGSLTYISTTPRDLQAAAWLLTKGARLDIVRDYLNYAMNDEQKALYDRLSENLETHTIQGHAVTIGSARVNHYVEEISGIASRIRDLYQPEALFILVEMADHVQVVARSVTDAINVGHIAEFFEGGGHARAAAALIKDKKLEPVKKELLRLLHLEVQPALTVAKIMSKGARILAPTDTVQYTAEMMDRYGHEGFPVVDSHTQKIVGIISRREVDKARRHKLDGAAISYFMKKGEFFVTPADSVDTVQQLMTEQQIGQVPVVSEVDGSVIGIVTRTDLINLWQLAGAEKSTRPNLAPQLEKALSSELLTFLRDAGELAAGNGDALYMVGGFVRDLLLTMLMTDEMVKKTKTSPRFDLDLVVEGDAIALAHHLQERHGGRVRSHRRFGTAKWILDQPIPFDAPHSEVRGGYLSSLDFVTARTEFYRHPSALPEVEQSSIRQDLHRRDFTINTLALRLSPDNFGELLDFYGGQSDLEAGLIRVLHNLSFVEDPTRILRAARLIARLDFKLEERTAELLENALDLLQRVSGERITHELELIFRERHPAKALRQLDELGILAVIHPGLMVDDLLLDRLGKLRTGLQDTPWHHTKPELVHYLGLMTFWLARDELEILMERLNLRTSQRAILKQTYTIHRQAAKIAQAQQASQLYHLLEGTSDEARLIAWLGLDNEAARQQLVRFQSELRDIASLIDGHYLKSEFRLPPGPIYRIIIEALRDARLDGLVTSLADERALVERILAEQPTKQPPADDRQNQ